MGLEAEIQYRRGGCGMGGNKKTDLPLPNLIIIIASWKL
jgi:hypothetical protein